MAMDKRNKTTMVNGEILLPEPMIHCIQSFLTGKESARTTILSKSWYSAWLTRHTLDLNNIHFHHTPFAEFATKTMQRYQDLNLKLESFRLQLYHYVNRLCGWYDDLLVHNLIINAMKIGATDLNLMLNKSILPPEVLASETLVRLSLKACKINGNYHVSCSKLKSLYLESMCFKGDDVLLFRDIISCCISIEELSLSMCSGFAVSRMNLFELHKLRRLSLHCVAVDAMFFSDFASRFPCLKYLSLVSCHFYSRIHIASTSLEHIRFSGGHSVAMFDVPNIRKFTYSYDSLPSSFSIKAASRDWDFDISISCGRFEPTSWFLNLKKFLTEFRRRSRISLSVCLLVYDQPIEHEVDIEVVAEAVVVENLTIDDVPSAFCCALLVRLFGICRPKLLTTYGRTAECCGWSLGNETLGIICKRLMHQVMSPSCGIPQQNMFGQFGLKEVNMEVYEQFRTGWLPLVLKEPLDTSITFVNRRKVRFQLTWGISNR